MTEQALQGTQQQLEASSAALGAARGNSGTAEEELLVQGIFAMT